MMNGILGASGEEPVFRLLGMAFMAPVAGYVLITPAHHTTKTCGQFLRAFFTILVSGIILAVTTSTDWHIGHVAIRTQYSSFSRGKIDGSLGIRIGLSNANIQLKGSVPDSPLTTVEFSEKFSLLNGNNMRYQYVNALQRGLPFPMITAVEYLSLDNEAFRWNGSYSQAGYYTNFLLWCSFALWLLTNVLWPVNAIYSAICLSATGFLLIVSNFVYTINLPKRALVIPYDGNNLEFSYGWCYFTALTLGVLCVSFGSCAYVINSVHSSNTLQEFSAVISKQRNKTWKSQISNWQKLHTKDICWSQ